MCNRIACNVDHHTWYANGTLAPFFMAAHTCNMRRGAVASPVRGNHNVALVMSTHGAEQRLWVASSRSRCGQGGRWRRCTRSSCNGTILAPTAHVLARNAQNGSRWPANCVFHHIRLPASVRLTSMCSTRTASSYAAKLNGPHPAAASVKAPLKKKPRGCDKPRGFCDREGRL